MTLLYSATIRFRTHVAALLLSSRRMSGAISTQITSTDIQLNAKDPKQASMALGRQVGMEPSFRRLHIQRLRPHVPDLGTVLDRSLPNKYLMTINAQFSSNDSRGPPHNVGFHTTDISAQLSRSRRRNEGKDFYSDPRITDISDLHYDDVQVIPSLPQ